MVARIWSISAPLLVRVWREASLWLIYCWKLKTIPSANAHSTKPSTHSTIINAGLVLLYGLDSKLWLFCALRQCVGLGLMGFSDFIYLWHDRKFLAQNTRTL